MKEKPTKPNRPNPIKNDVRKEKKKKQPGKACYKCGSKRNLHKHHVCGRTNDRDLTVWICKFCHIPETAGHPAAGVDLRHTQRSYFERLESIFRALALLFSQFGDKFREWADVIAAHISFLDNKYPGWDEVPA